MSEEQDAGDGIQRGGEGGARDVLRRLVRLPAAAWRNGGGIRFRHPHRLELAPAGYTHDVHRRWGSVFWRSWARVIRGRLPVIGRPNADILHHGPPPAYAHGREAVGGAEVWL
jgi:hypothetical protein